MSISTYTDLGFNKDTCDRIYNLQLLKCINCDPTNTNKLVNNV
jgi:hypothetical protein